MRFTDLLIKDIKNIVYDVKSLAIILIMPIVLMSILGMSLQGVFGDEDDSGVAMTRIGIVKAYDYEDEIYKVEGRIDLSAYDQDTLESLDAQKNFFSLMDSDDLSSFLVYNLYEQEEGYEALKDGDISALIILPKNFVFNSYMMLEGSRLVTDIEYYINPDNAFFATIIQGIIEGYTDMNNHIYAQQRVMAMTLLSSGNGEALASINDRMDQEAMEIGQINLTVQSTNRQETINSFQYYAAAIMCMFLLYSAGIGGRALLEERNEKVIPRLTVGGHSLFKLVMSNFVRVMILAIIQSVIMISYSSIVLGVDWGSLLTVSIAVLCSSFAIASIGMLIAVITLIANNYKVANLFEFAVVYIMALVGGSFIPVEGLPDLLQKLGFVSVNGQALKMYINGMYQLPLSSSIEQMMVMFGFGAVFITLSLILIKGRGRELAC